LRLNTSDFFNTERLNSAGEGKGDVGEMLPFSPLQVVKLNNMSY